MKISSVQSPINFGQVFVLSGTQSQINQARKVLSSSDGDCLYISATTLYANNELDKDCQNDARKGKNLDLVITGKEDLNNVMTGKPGWKTLPEISKHVNKVFRLGDDIRKQMKEIQKTMIK